jgi:hypothetical protein
MELKTFAEDSGRDKTKGVIRMSQKVTMTGETLTRRSLLVGTSKLAVGTAILSAAAGGLFSRTSAKEMQKWPWGYKKIDPSKAARIGYEKYYEGACCYGVVSAIIIPLRETIGEPYASLPLEAFHFGHSGVVGWGTICGTLLGSGIATGFIAGKEGEEILNQLIGWYTETPLPTFMPAQPKTSIRSTSRSDSPLCHISAGKWMKKENVSFGSAPRKERCARLAADVAAKAVILLNEWADRKLGVQESHVKMYGIPAQNNCMGCHGTSIPKLPG